MCIIIFIIIWFSMIEKEIQKKNESISINCRIDITMILIFSSYSPPTKMKAFNQDKIKRKNRKKICSVPRCTQFSI